MRFIPCLFPSVQPKDGEPRIAGDVHPAVGYNRYDVGVAAGIDPRTVHEQLCKRTAAARQLGLESVEEPLGRTGCCLSARETAQMIASSGPLDETLVKNPLSCTLAPPTGEVPSLTSETSGEVVTPHTITLEPPSDRRFLPLPSDSKYDVCT